MGAAPGLIQKIYDNHASYQRPIFTEEKEADIVVTEDNWPDYLGKSEAYGAFFKFFRKEVERLGVSSTLGTYVFRSEANVGGKSMLDRLVSGALHPMIQVGYGLEFGSDVLVATGLAQTAVHQARTAELFPYSADPPATRNEPSAGPGRQPSNGPSLLEIFRQIYDSEVLAPPLPYNPDLLLSERVKGATEGPKGPEIRRICEQYTLSIPNDASEEELNSRVEEIIWVATLLMFATGREGREHRFDFFLMHLVTSSFFFEPMFKALEDTKSKVALIRHYIPVMVITMLARGRPVIRPHLVQDWSITPRPITWRDVLGFKSDKGSGVGDMKEDEDYNPWPVLIQGALHHPDIHTAKAMRTLILAERKYGDLPSGGVIGAFQPAKGKSEETFPGMANLDGTLFVRAAGVMMNFMRWTVCGQPSGNWDSSALGWDGAWENKN